TPRRPSTRHGLPPSQEKGCGRSVAVIRSAVRVGLGARRPAVAGCGLVRQFAIGCQTLPDNARRLRGRDAMKLLGFFTVVALVMAGGIGLLSAAAQKEGGVTQELKKFQGKWAPVSVTVDGKTQEEDEIKDRFMVVKGAKAIAMYKDKERGTASLKLDP